MGLLDMFRKKEFPKEKSEIDELWEMVETCRKCVKIYGDFINSPSFPKSGFVADTSKLPGDKKFLKFALKIVIQTTYDGAKREMLKIHYANLANFQQGVGSKDICIFSTGLSEQLKTADNSQEKGIMKEYVKSLDAQTNKWLHITAEESLNLYTEAQSFYLPIAPPEI